MSLIMLSVAVALSATAPPTPFLGVSTSAWSDEVTVNEQTFARALRVDTVTPGSGAAAAGLKEGDLIVAADGMDFSVAPDELTAQLGAAIRSRQVGDKLTLTVVRDSVEQSAKLGEDAVAGDDAWDRVKQAMEDIGPGEAIEFHAQHRRQIVTITAQLGERPAALDNLKPTPPNEQILAAPPAPSEAERLVDALIAEFSLSDAYAAQRSMLADLVAQRDDWCPLRTAYVMREPFALPALSRELADVPEDVSAILAHAGAWLDLPVAELSVPKWTGVDSSPEAHARHIEAALQPAVARCRQAFTALSDEERTFLTEHIDLVAESLLDDVMIQRDPDKQRLADVLRVVELSARVDRAELITAARHVTEIFNPVYLDRLRHDLAGHGEGVFLTHHADFGDIVFAGAGSTWHADSATVIIDLGGDDFYTCATAEPLSVIVDLGGDDEYAATFSTAQGAARMGVALLYDEAGNDRYRGRRWTQGAGLLGVGVLHDHAGDDSYRGGDFGQAAAFSGVGLLIDDAGDDRYDIERFGQSLALPGGFAALVDRGGDDHYYCKGRDLGAYGTPGVFAGWGQGCGVGLRGVASGGVALLLDAAGGDTYEAGNFSQGGGYYFGWGALVDRGGDDRYLGSRYAQAFAAHQALGFLEDYAGDDIYRVSREVGQSCSWDQTVTALIDDSGDDVYSCGGFALGASAHNGVALFVDAAGRDVYERNAGRARATPNDYHGGTCLSLVIDLGGDADTYSGDADANNKVRKADQHGFFADVRGGWDDTLARFREWLER